MTRPSKQRKKRAFGTGDRIAAALSVAAAAVLVALIPPAPGHAEGNEGNEGDEQAEQSERDEQPPAPLPMPKAGELMPDNHSVDWMTRHGEIARSDADSCTNCHTERDCASCHDEKVAEPFSVHPPNFETLHAVDARARRGDCAECHTLENFCTDCHARTRDTSSPQASPPPRRDFHPDGWTDPNAPNNHGVMARRNISECVTCHTESDCVSCHRGVDPHPPEFRLNCGRWLEANPRPCAECHSDMASLKRKCSR